MIDYSNGGMFKLCRLRGSVFPKSLLLSLPCAVLAALLKHYTLQGDLDWMESETSVLKESQAWSGFSFLVGFLVVFRTSQAYTRFWDGCTTVHQMRAEWFDACSCLIAFCKHSTVETSKISTFTNTVVRLCSMLHASALAELEEINQLNTDIGNIKAFSFDLIDPEGIDARSLQVLKHSTCKVELVFSWIQMLIVDNIGTGVLSIPPPILSRAFQEIANGMVAFQDALKITYIPFPFPYAQTCDSLLLVHWILTPIVTAQWVSSPAWAAVFASIQVFVLWSLNWIAVEIENPFGRDENDLDGKTMQQEMNHHLLLLLQRDTFRTPELTETACRIEDSGMAGTAIRSFHDVWSSLEDPASAAAHAAGTIRRSAVGAGGNRMRRSGSKSSVRFSGTSGASSSTGGGRAPEWSRRASDGTAPPSGRRESYTCEEAGYVLSDWQPAPLESIPSLPDRTASGLGPLRATQAQKSDTAEGGWDPLSPAPPGGSGEESGHSVRGGNHRGSQPGADPPEAEAHEAGSREQGITNARFHRRFFDGQRSRRNSHSDDAIMRVTRAI